VLFADVKGSMGLAEQLDPEEWSAIMQRFFRILADGAERGLSFAVRLGVNSGEVVAGKIGAVQSTLEDELGGGADFRGRTRLW
jgi:class 3 adenylate cyclase